MKILSLDHVTINCIDVKTASKFYEEILGLKPLDTVDLGDHILHYYELPGTKLELIEYLEEQKIYQTGNTDEGIYRHFAVVVDDLTEAYNRCKAADVPINLPPTFVAPLGKTVMLIKDPNGVEVELIQQS